MDFLQIAAAPVSAAHIINHHGVVEMLKQWLVKFTDELRDELSSNGCARVLRTNPPR